MQLELLEEMVKKAVETVEKAFFIEGGCFAVISIRVSDPGFVAATCDGDDYVYNVKFRITDEQGGSIKYRINFDNPEKSFSLAAPGTATKLTDEGLDPEVLDFIEEALATAMERILASEFKAGIDDGGVSLNERVEVGRWNLREQQKERAAECL